MGKDGHGEEDGCIHDLVGLGVCVSRQIHRQGLC